ncbi:uncharacterized protein SPPG_04553 [Spizellomyces punctatus DAOM BR117]|uniref:Uncharacterized protein n=1 Tax=Spizellomyces punctatus (strain DAOM BR117) TaxID=645134 RepID=A0A0L0HGJ6_SPIPD|nr:uncharacterized protein SPPG_04553 [Spizellomyces punctatus DAOM BR117]KND00218.1 hypothetical protein SPPG_04553 [Spizellomyces punctatus DAOM BR117]|eukprot:XP_016608257.1 hypothetical protein SPPG_04553 [Spizellomyces punctatus DAOM BR117]
MAAVYSHFTPFELLGMTFPPANSPFYNIGTEIPSNMGNHAPQMDSAWRATKDRHLRGTKRRRSMSRSPLGGQQDRNAMDESMAGHTGKVGEMIDSNLCGQEESDDVSGIHELRSGDPKKRRLTAQPHNVNEDHPPSHRQFPLSPIRISLRSTGPNNGNEHPENTTYTAINTLLHIIHQESRLHDPPHGPSYTSNLSEQQGVIPDYVGVNGMLKSLHLARRGGLDNSHG